ncbi:MAG: non-heme iron oxygenase ferredoxin subunit [Anaerolineae bacterium]|nr:non-heme iron oxygenase ferredoxin subunit [Anaerolineae bacterium]
MSSFVTVAAVDDLPPGERIVTEVNGTWIIILNVDGEYFAVEDLCSHEEYYLSEGQLDGFSLECPKHGACFDLRNGKPLCPPAITAIKRFAVRVEGGDVQVGGRL